MRDQSRIILDRATLQAAFNDLPSEGHQVIRQELLDLLLEEIVQDPGSLVIRFITDFGLRIDLEEPGADGATFHRDLIRVPSQ